MQQLRRGLTAPSGLRAVMSSFMDSNNRALLSNNSLAPTLTCLRNLTVSNYLSAADAEQGVSANKAVSFLQFAILWSVVSCHNLFFPFLTAHASQALFSISLTLQQINRMLYRARQRGWLELDLLIGMWAEREVGRLTPEMLTDVEVLLNQENPELYKWLTGQIEPPTSMLSNLAFQSIRGEVSAAMEAHGLAAAAAKDGVEWVNAWQEYKKQLEDSGASLGGESTSKSS